LKAATYTPTQRIGNLVADALMGLGMQPYTANDLTSRLGNVLGLSPLGVAGSALDLIDAKRRDDLPGAVVAAAGMVPGAKGVTRGVAEEAGAAYRRAVPKDVAFATHEAIPGADTEHLAGSINASPEARAAYSADPRSTWAFAPGGREMLSHLNVTPELRAVLNDNADIPKAALARLERDQAYSKQWGATREDIQNARKIIGEGKGWVDRLESAIKAGAILPSLGFAILGDRSGDRS
jgi:hypothetical protein